MAARSSLLLLLPFLLLVFEEFGRARALDYNNLSDVPCGQRGVTRSGRVVGGENATPREFPWLVSITRFGGHFCGGTIVNAKFVLTAAHCLCSELSRDFIPPTQLRVTLGEHDLTKPEVPAARQERVVDVRVHPEHVCGRYKHDVALLELARPIVWSESVKPACLPAGNDQPGYSTFSGENAVAAGWGWLGEDRANYKRATVLQKVAVRVVENGVCREWYASKGKSTRVQSDQMCAGHEEGGRDSCWADSGGPLMIGRQPGDATIVVGVVSSGVGCARPRLPGLYTRVSDYMPWIARHTLLRR